MSLNIKRLGNDPTALPNRLSGLVSCQANNPETTGRLRANQGFGTV